MAAPTRRINALVPAAVYDDLANLAAARGRSMSEILRQAIELEKWWQGATEEGGKVLYEKPNGDVREIVLR